ncbi:MAG: hypothetical protein WC045_00320 [Patescibacteria group bacterium]
MRLKNTLLLTVLAVLVFSGLVGCGGGTKVIGNTPRPVNPPCNCVIPSRIMVNSELSAGNPTSGTLVTGEVGREIARFKFTNTGTDATSITEMRLAMTGTINKTYLFDAATGEMINWAPAGSGRSTAIFWGVSGLAISESKEISVRVDVGNQGGMIVQAELLTFKTSDDINTIANLSGNLFTTATATLASATFGSVTPSGGSVPRGGAQVVTIWSSNLTVQGRNASLRRLNLRQIGSAQLSNLSNFRLYTNGVNIGQSGVVYGNTVVFTIPTATAIASGSTKDITVKADISVTASGTINLSLEQPADIDLVDTGFNVGIGVTQTPVRPASPVTIQ